ncbi:MAG: hypothetical protein A2W19_13920 [Spirochaetes bacterium RBG_16_49_21]|nr:MAG: hypothetical protein A2W19_13920 [Spirochaetes bacterium RBG_16_49_21]
MQSLKEISDILQGINAFISSIAFISQTIGYDTILVFIAIIIFSIGFSSLGVPRGKASFLVSLAAVDSLWILWKAGITARFPDYLLPMLKTNLIVLAPLIIVAILARMFPFLRTAIKRAALSPFRKTPAFDKKSLVALYEEYQAQSGALNASILFEMLSSGAEEKIVLSAATVKTIDTLKSILAKFDAGKK